MVMERKNIVTLLGNHVTLMGPELKVGDRAPGFTVLDRELKERGLEDFRGKIKLISVTPSLDTPVCEVQTRRFNEEMDRLPAEVAALNISVDLPFAIKRFCALEGIDHVQAYSDHRDTSFGMAYGVLMKETRLLARSVFVIDRDDIIRYMEIVPDTSHHPDYDRALDAVNQLLAVKA